MLFLWFFLLTGNCNKPSSKGCYSSEGYEQGHARKGALKSLGPYSAGGPEARPFLERRTYAAYGTWAGQTRQLRRRVCFQLAPDRTLAGTALCQRSQALGQSKPQGSRLGSTAAAQRRKGSSETFTQGSEPRIQSIVDLDSRRCGFSCTRVHAVGGDAGAGPRPSGHGGFGGRTCY